MNQFYVGQEVVCIDAKYAPIQNVSIPCELVEGQIYTIRWIGEFNNYIDPPFIGVRLVGLDRGVDPTYGYDDPPFAARRFRPLVKDPIAVFRQIAADPDFKVTGPEGPVRDVPDDGQGVKEREKEGA
ncbi:hypothetical protein [Mesorhizobium sp. DCY119]|uniref:hypothetical protein n=1 Tax=Mesorhizobium sp. DCY119 TaxID=2108445 RepID=UPI001FDEA689|nr:hypothetical protein [Mesorhizobium sp. DCY119]